jgi:FMN phosphatase YigB (HAD superfamily)/DNA-binding XRE family transcriptional regulator
MDERALGRKLQLARKRAGLTQQELCQKAGLSYSTLAKIERGAIRTPSVFTVANIAAVTGTSIEDLLDMKSRSAAAPPARTKKRSKNGVRFVYFDINGVLVHYLDLYKSFNEIAELAAVTPEVVETLFWRYNDEICRGQLSVEDFNATMAQGLNLQSFDWRHYYMKSISVVDGVSELVKWVAEHYEVGLLSNSMPGFVDELRQTGKLPDVNYAAIVDSSQVGSIKPEAKIYEVAQELAGMEPGEILLIDNERPNLTAADKYGWQVLGFDDFSPADGIERIKQSLAF